MPRVSNGNGNGHGANGAKRLGILTLHSSYNDGSVLQALALQRHLARCLPQWAVEIIDLRYRAKQAYYQRATHERAATLQRFIDTQLPVSAERFLVGARERRLGDVGQGYQALVVGSDEVWKLRYTRWLGGLLRVQRDPGFPAFPNAYWPDASWGAARFAYAASIGATVWGDIPERHRAAMRRILGEFRELGVRDEATQAFLDRLDPELGSRAVRVPDPTFAVDLVDADAVDAARAKLTHWGVDFGRPRVGVFLRVPAGGQMRAVIDGFRGAGYQVIGMTLKDRGFDVNLNQRPITPPEWAAMAGLMDVCVSERMHGCIMSLLAGRPVIAIDRMSRPGEPPSKVWDLMKRFGLSRFCHEAAPEASAELLAACRLVRAGQWPHAEVKSVKAELRNDSQAFGQRIASHLQEAARHAGV